MATTELERQAELGENAWLIAEELESKQALIQESFSLVQGILKDLVGQLPAERQDEYSDDLARLDQLAHLLM